MVVGTINLLRQKQTNKQNQIKISEKPVTGQLDNTNNRIWSKSLKLTFITLNKCNF